MIFFLFDERRSFLFYINEECGNGILDRGEECDSNASDSGCRYGRCLCDRNLNFFPNNSIVCIRSTFPSIYCVLLYIIHFLALIDITYRWFYISRLEIDENVDLCQSVIIREDCVQLNCYWCNDFCTSNSTCGIYISHYFIERMNWFC
jgi:hypothetical protein